MAYHAFSSKERALYTCFLTSCGIILTLTAAAKLVSAAGNAAILRDLDPLLRVQNRTLLYSVAVAESVVVIFITFGRGVLLKMVSVAWLSLCFLSYRIGDAIIGVTTCPCLGNITDNLHLRPSLAQ